MKRVNRIRELLTYTFVRGELVDLVESLIKYSITQEESIKVLDKRIENLEKSNHNLVYEKSELKKRYDELQHRLVEKPNTTEIEIKLNNMSQVVENLEKEIEEIVRQKLELVRTNDNLSKDLQTATSVIRNNNEEISKLNKQNASLEQVIANYKEVVDHKDNLEHELIKKDNEIAVLLKAKSEAEAEALRFGTIIDNVVAKAKIFAAELEQERRLAEDVLNEDTHY